MNKLVTEQEAFEAMKLFLENITIGLLLMT